MVTTVLTFAALCIVGSCAFEDWNHLKLRFGVVDAYHDIPLTKAGLLDNGYGFMVHDDELNVDFYAYKQDPRVSIGVDTYGHIAAVRVGFIKKDLPLKAQENNEEFIYDLESKPMFKSATYYGVDVFYNTLLFVSPEKLLAGGRPENNGNLAEDIYVRVNGEWSTIPRNECNATAANYVKEGCFLGMGRHYFYRSRECQDIQGVFGLYDNHELVGMGFTTFGSNTYGPDRRWQETLNTLAVRIILPTRPDCLIDWTAKYGITSFHMFFVKHPRLIMCGDGDPKC